MTNVRDAVARAICESEMGIEMLDAMPNSAPRYYGSADAAILACGYEDMRRALHDAKLELEHVHYFTNDGQCQWSEETEKHCPGLCNQVGCFAKKIECARVALERSKGN